MHRGFNKQNFWGVRNLIKVEIKILHIMLLNFRSYSIKIRAARPCIYIYLYSAVLFNTYYWVSKLKTVNWVDSFEFWHSVISEHLWEGITEIPKHDPVIIHYDNNLDYFFFQQQQLPNIIFCLFSSTYLIFFLDEFPHHFLHAFC